jgi:hypothetical protein
MLRVGSACLVGSLGRLFFQSVTSCPLGVLFLIMPCRYVFSPFGIICPICKYKVSGISSADTIGRSLYRNVLERTSHTKQPTPAECNVIANQYICQMSQVANLVSRQPTIALARRELATFLVNPSQPFPYCAACKTVVFDKREHAGKRHMKLCKELQEGFSIVSWTRNDPMVILVPIDLNNQSLFCSVFWQIFSPMEKRWLLLSQQNVPHDRSLIVNNPQEEIDPLSAACRHVEIIGFNDSQYHWTRTIPTRIGLIPQITGIGDEVLCSACTISLLQRW